MSFVTQKVQNLPYSGIRKFFNLAEEMDDVVSLGVGEPDFFTPWHIREEAIYTLEHRRTCYSANAGMLPLRKAISQYAAKQTGVYYDPKTQVIVTVGASEALDLVMRAILNEGDEVLLVEPCFVSYKACIELAGGVAVSVPLSDAHQFRLTPGSLISKITPRTKAILVGFPNNPTGAVMTRADWQPICDYLKDQNILLISDEIYAELTYTPAPHVSPAGFPGMSDKTLVINGFSKSYAMTGWRLGYACGSPDLIDAMNKIHQYCIMCAPTVEQYAAIEALQNGAESVRKMRTEYNERRQFMLDRLAEMNIPCFEPFGAFYLFPDISGFGMSSEDFAAALLEKGQLAVVPGSAFGAGGEGHIRVSYAYSIDALEEALGRLRRFL